MSHSEHDGKESLRWALITGQDNGDDDFRNRRAAMKAGAADSNLTEIMSAAQDMFKRGHEDQYANLSRCEAEDPGSIVRWSRQILGI
jgi:hypothetical protein